ncbi:flavin-containing monooxygenase 5-like [Haliotis rufescens]|uniref:flavin-containing monooxygenase 5-like n=1 Tax=Haliotis rufescens TaxID=6454 RepID=UPI00201F15A7|nr:flavin-containing monooxygenase 5-like [Haliotis rufescens]XP_048250028.1 flavin-containing monooxygenase 5-like [Haliotis rufescens]
MEPKKRAAIIGAGISGLAAIKSCLEEGLEPECLEQFDDIGGFWSHSGTFQDGQGAMAFDNLTANTPKDMFCYSDFPYEDDVPPYPTRAYVHEYLNSFCDKFDLRKYIHFKTVTRNIRESEDYDVTGKWEVETTDGSEAVHSHVYDFVFVCSGYCSDAKFPLINGLETFRGSTEHSKTFKDGSKYADKRVLVIGTGNSAGDLAVTVSHVAKQVYMTVGRGSFIVPRLVEGGIPWSYATQRRALLKNKNNFANIVRATANSRLNHVATGINLTNSLKSSALIINDFLHIQIVCGRVKIVGNLIRVGDHEAEFKDGTVLRDLDAILFATGYLPGLTFLSDKAKGGTDKQYRYKMTFPLTLTHNTLALIGCFESGSTVIAVTEMQARWAARVFSGRCQLPARETMMADVDKWNKFVVRKFGRYKYKVPNLVIRDEMAAELGVAPSWWDLVKAGPRLAYQYYYGPAFPYYYRLWGPHSWCGAEKAIYNALEHGYIPKPVMTLKPAVSQKSSSVNLALTGAAVAGAVMLGSYQWKLLQ